MIFRVRDGKLYEIKVKNEQLFLDKQKNGAIEFNKIEENMLPEYDGKAFYMLDENDNIVLDIERIEEFKADTLEEIKKTRYQQLEKILSEKWLGIQAIAIDKEWMTDEKAIQAQIDSYSKLEDGAREILKSDAENETALAIVAKADEAKLLTFQANALMQKVRGILEVKIEENDPKIDEKLSFARGFKMSKEDISEEEQSAEMANNLITYLEN